jgi:photosystem II stability/assembly factor-like uncharacterized protein
MTARCLFIASLVGLCPAFAGWELVPSGTTQALRDVRFITPQKGFIAGDNGTLLKSLDSGKTWSQGLQGFSNGFRGISFRDTLRGVLGGTQGAILFTSDGGETWLRAQTPDTLTEVRDVFLFPAANHGVATGAKGNTLRIWRTTDGGANWLLQDSTWPRSNGEPGQRFAKPSSDGGEVCFSGLDTGYVASGIAQGTSGLLRTVDGGLSWVDFLPPVHENKIFTTFVGCHFITGRAGFFAGSAYGDVSKTGNALVDTLRTKLVGPFRDVHFPTPAIGYAVGYMLTQTSPIGRIFKTTDTGETWGQQGIPQTHVLLKTFFLNSNYGFAVGAFGAILRTTDGGGSPVGVVPPRRGSAPSVPRFKSPLGRFFDALGRSVRQMRFFGHGHEGG